MRNVRMPMLLLAAMSVTGCATAVPFLPSPISCGTPTDLSPPQRLAIADGLDLLEAELPAAHLATDHALRGLQRMNADARACLDLQKGLSR